MGGLDGLDDAVLRRLGALVALRATLGLDWSSMAGLFGDLTGDLYDAVFVRSGVAQADPVFQPGVDGSVLPKPGPAIADHVTALAAAVGLQPDEVSGFCAARGIDKLDLSAASAVWREARLASALKMSIGDMDLLATLAGKPPLETIEAARPLSTCPCASGRSFPPLCACAAFAPRPRTPRR